MDQLWDDLEQEDIQALHRVYLAARAVTLDGVPYEQGVAELESAVLAAMDAMPYELKGKS